MELSKSVAPKRVLVVGGGGGIGRTIAKFFDESGWKISILSRKINESGVNISFYEADLRVPAQIEAAFEKIKRDQGSFDAVINGSGLIQDQLLINMPEPAWDDVVNVNLSAAFRITRFAAPLLEKAGGGHLIHFSSISGVTGRRGQGNYAAAKAGLVALAKNAARELGEKNIRVNVIIPGFLRTPMTAKISAEQEEQIRRDNALGRIGTVDEVARFVHFLCSTENISGQVFNLDSRILPSW